MTSPAAGELGDVVDSATTDVRGPREVTLRRVWARTVGTLTVLMVFLGLVAFFATSYQSSRSSTAAQRLQAKAEVLIALEQALSDATEPLTVVLYRMGDEEQRTAAGAAYRQHADAVEGAFDRAIAAADGAGLDHLRSARELWNEVTASVDASAELTSEHIYELVLRGDDPFRPAVWERIEEIQGHRMAAGREAVADLRSHNDLFQELTRLVAVAVGLGTVAALTLGLLSVWRLKRRVLAPLGELRDGALAMGDTGDEREVDVPFAAAEIRDVAAAINATSLSLRAAHDLLHVQANSDHLTALANRKSFGERLGAMLDEPTIRSVGVLFIDLDDFKNVNDSISHAAGDELLRVVANRLRSITRGGELVARLGGDEFAVAVEIDEDPSVTIRVAERVLAALSDPVSISGTVVQVGCSIGVTVSHPGDTSDSVDQLLSSADFAMYMAKGQGKNRHEFYSSGMHAEMLERMELRRDLASAVQHGQLELQYQPIVELDSGSVVGFEALVRWHHPDHGLLMPSEFITLAEETGVIHEIGGWVLDRACAELGPHHGADEPPMINVNVSARQLADPDFVRNVLLSLHTHGVSPDRLVLEMTESTAITNTESGCTALAELREQGVHVALDDFGTGFSSLRYLGDLPVDVIKVDRSFVASEAQSRRSLLEAIILLAQRLDLAIVAEGIETHGELQRLRDLGTMAGQGYLFARPMPAAAALAYRDLTVARCMPSTPGIRLA